jgi:hypothetical protein
MSAEGLCPSPGVGGVLRVMMLMASIPTVGKLYTCFAAALWIITQYIDVKRQISSGIVRALALPYQVSMHINERILQGARS